MTDLAKKYGIGEREIRFRYWNGDTMFDWDYFLDEGDNLRDFFETVYGHAHMQYTGLKDKKGVDIYEGDIVNNDGEIGVVIQHAGSWFAQVAEGHYSGIIASSSGLATRSRVVGNIFEHPHLLESND